MEVTFLLIYILETVKNDLPKSLTGILGDEKLIPSWLYYH